MLAHVLADRPAFSHGSPVDVERCRGDMLETAQLLLERISSDSAPQRQPRVRLAFGEPLEKIMALGDEEDAQLLIVGWRGRGAVDAAVLGGVSGRLAARSARPVLVVPPKGAREFRRSLSEREPSLVCGVDGSEALRRQFSARREEDGAQDLRTGDHHERPGRIFTRFITDHPSRTIRLRPPTLTERHQREQSRPRRSATPRP